MRVLIVGYYGFGLVSDDAVLQSLVDDLADFDSDIRISATTAGRAPLQVHGIDEVPIGSFSAVLTAIRGSDLVIIGGGGVYNEDNVYNGATFLTARQEFNDLCAAVPILCACAGKPCAIIGVGVFSITSHALRCRVQEAFAAASIATVRDQGSLITLTQGSIQEIAATVTADPVFRLQGEAPPGANVSQSCKSGPIIGVSLRHWNTNNNNASFVPDKWEAEVASALDHFLERHNAQCIFFPFQNMPENGVFSDDIPVIERVCEQMRCRDRTNILPIIASPRIMAWHIGSVDLMICMRYHSLIMAIGQERPFVALGYSEKIRNTLADCKLELAEIDISEIDAQNLYTLLESEYQKINSTKSLRAVVASTMAERAGQNIAHIRELIAKPIVGRVNGAFIAPFLFDSVRRASQMEEIIFADDTSIDTKIKLAQVLADDAPSDREASYRLGRLLIERHCTPNARHDDAAKAEHYLTIGLFGGTDEYWSRFFLGAAKYHLGRFEEALAELRLAASVRPDRDDWVSIMEAAKMALRNQSES